MLDKLKKISKKTGTPSYVFSEHVFCDRAKNVKEAFGEKVDLCFSIKANPFLLAALPEEFKRIEVCSPGELEICKALKIDPEKIIFSGVNKSEGEIDDAVNYGVHRVTIESRSHLESTNRIGEKAGVKIPVLVRLSDESQFGLDEEEVLSIIEHRDDYPGIEIKGLHFFTGTQKRRAKVILRELDRVEKLIDKISEEYGLVIEEVEYGTGLDVDYFPEAMKDLGKAVEASTSDDAAEGADVEAAETALDIDEIRLESRAAQEAAELERLNDIAEGIRALGEKVHLTVEMGRFFAASCGFYFTRVIDVKTNGGTNYAILDGGLHQVHYDGQFMGMQIPLIWHIKDEEAVSAANKAANAKAGKPELWTLCGSLCSTNDVLARGVAFENFEIGDILVFTRVGAYSLMEAMSTFLSRDIPSVWLAKDDELIKLREHIQMNKFNLAFADLNI